MNVQSKAINSIVPISPNQTDEQEEMTIRAETRQRWLVINILRILIGVVAISGWEWAARTGVIDPFFWGQPSEIWKQLVYWYQHGTAQGPLWEQIYATLKEAVYGFIIGTVLGIFMGIVLGRIRFLADVLGPYIKAANSIPRIVLGSIFTIALGLGIASKVALAVVLVFFIVFFNAFQGVREVDRNLLANAKILGANQRQMSTAVILPSALTWIIASLHTSFSFALVGAVVGEYLGAIQGLGNMIQTAQGTFNVNGVFACIVILSALALVAEALITALENRLLRWRPSTANDATL